MTFRYSFVKVRFFPQTVCPHYGVPTVRVRSGVLRGVHFRPRLSTAQARTKYRLRRQYRTDRPDFGSYYVLPVSVHFLNQNVVLITWQAQEIGEFWEGRNVILCVKARKNACFGDLERRFLHASREKRALEFHFLRVSRRICLFWRFGSSFLVSESLVEMLVFGSLDLRF